MLLTSDNLSEALYEKLETLTTPVFEYLRDSYERAQTEVRMLPSSMNSSVHLTKIVKETMNEVINYAVTVLLEHSMFPNAPPVDTTSTLLKLVELAGINVWQKFNVLSLQIHGYNLILFFT